MRLRHRCLILLLPGGLAACDPALDVRAARAAFWSWHAAMQRGDREAVRALVTFQSRDYVAGIALERAQAGRPTIQQERVAGNQAWFRVVEADASAAGTYVVVREDGQWRVDLIETAGHNSREVALPGPSMKWQFIPVPAVGTPRR